MAMIDYPYPTSFLNPVPAWPVTAACQSLVDNMEKVSDKRHTTIHTHTRNHAYAHMRTRTYTHTARTDTWVLTHTHTQGGNVLTGLAAAVGVYYNYTGEQMCYNTSDQGKGIMQRERERERINFDHFLLYF